MCMAALSAGQQEVSTMRGDFPKGAKFTVCAALLVAVFFARPAAAQEGESLAKAQKLIDDHKIGIARFMHPTSSLDNIACTKTNIRDAGEFYVVYCFWFDHGKYQSSLRFKFYEDGSLDTIEVAGTSTWIKPFQAMDLFLKALMHFVPTPYASHVASF